MFTQLITPNPDISCQPGWCLKYVQDAYGVGAVYPTAISAWLASPSKHADRDFPDGVTVPVWFSLVNEPAGHVALKMSDGSVYSTSDNSSTPHHHSSLDDLMRYYAYYGMTLTYLGWTEDVEGFPVISLTIATESATVTPIEDEAMTDAQMLELKLFIQGDNEARHVATRNAIVEELSKKISDANYDVKVFTQATDNSNADRVVNLLNAKA